MKDAYPGVNMILSFSRVGFNDKHTEALVEVYPDSSQARESPETILLRKTANAWRVALRHLEHELTSGAVIAGKCEPVDAPDKWPTVGEIEQLTGDLSLMSVGTSPDARGYGDTVLVRLKATDTLARYYIKRGPTSWERRTNGQIPLTGKIIDRATGRPKKGVQAYLFMSGSRAELILTDAPMSLWTVGSRSTRSDE